MGTRGEATRQKIVDSALRLFREEGFEAATMRRIADGAGVSLGNAYYYFEGKDDFVHELYVLVQGEHRAKALPLLKKGGALSANLSAALHTGLDVMAPYHRFGTSFVQVALPSSSHASPFSAESSMAREMAVDLMREVVMASRPRPSASLLESLPLLLWFVYLGVTLHWVVDASPGQLRTRRLVDGVAPLVGRAVRLARVPVARGLVDDTLALVQTLSPQPSQAGTAAG